MKLSITADVPLDEPQDDTGYLTWLDVRVGAPDTRLSGSARVALVHVGEIADAHGDVWRALHGTRLESLHDVYFAQGWYKDDYADGAGIDLLFVDHVEMEHEARARNLDLAVVRRLCDTLASGCQLVVMPYRDAHEAAHWARLGFRPSTPGRTAGFMHMKLGYRHARVIDTTGTGHYEVVPTFVLGDRTIQN